MGATTPSGSACSGPFLHSWRIAFDQPLTGERIELEEPLPEDLETALRLARAQTIERA